MKSKPVHKINFNKVSTKDMPAAARMAVANEGQGPLRVSPLAQSIRVICDNWLFLNGIYQVK